MNHISWLASLLVLLATLSSPIAAQVAKRSSPAVSSAAEKRLLSRVGSGQVVRTGVLRTRPATRIPDALGETLDGTTAFQEDPTYTAPFAAVGDTVTLVNSYTPWSTAVITARIPVRAGDRCEGGMPAKGWAYGIRRSNELDFDRNVVLRGNWKEPSVERLVPTTVRGAAATLQTQIVARLTDSVVAEVGDLSEAGLTKMSLRARIAREDESGRMTPWPIHPVRTREGVRYLIAVSLDTDVSDHGFYTFVQLLLDGDGTVLQRSGVPAGDPIVVDFDRDDIDEVYLGEVRLRQHATGYVVPTSKAAEGCD